MFPNHAPGAFFPGGMLPGFPMPPMPPGMPGMPPPPMGPMTAAPQQQQHDGMGGMQAGAGPGSSGMGRDRPQGRGFGFKTRLCQAFMDRGSCKWGTGCRYAHGEHELRPFEGPSQGAAGGQRGGGPGDYGAGGSDGFGKSRIMGPGPMGQSRPPEPGTSGRQHAPSGQPQQQQQQQQQQLPKRDEITVVDRVRAVCGALNIGNAAASSKDRPTLHKHVIEALKNGSAFKATPFADGVEQYLEHLTRPVQQAQE